MPMTIDTLCIGATPPAETCAQVGSPDYDARARRECARYINLLRQVFGQEPPGVTLRIKKQPHDFGSCFEVYAYITEDTEAAYEYALACEGYGPETWSDTRPRSPRSPYNIL